MIGDFSSDPQTASVERLMSNDDPDLVRQGVAMIEALDSQALVDDIMAGTGLDESGRMVWGDRLIALVAGRHWTLAAWELLRITGELDALERLVIHHGGTLDLSWLRAAPMLQELGLYNSALENIPAIAELSTLRSLSLRGYDRLDDLRPLAALVGLERLILRDCAAKNLGPLSGLRRLRVLSLSGCKRIDELGPLRSLRALEEVLLDGVLNQRDLSWLHPAARLRRLSLAGWGGLEDIEPLAAQTAMESLDLSGCQQLRDASPLIPMASLAELDITHCLWMQPRVWHVQMSSLEDVTRYRARIAQRLRDKQTRTPAEEERLGMARRLGLV